jgi:hypothetical protein
MSHRTLPSTCTCTSPSALPVHPTSLDHGGSSRSIKCTLLSCWVGTSGMFGPSVCLSAATSRVLHELLVDGRVLTGSVILSGFALLRERYLQTAVNCSKALSFHALYCDQWLVVSNQLSSKSVCRSEIRSSHIHSQRVRLSVHLTTRHATARLEADIFFFDSLASLCDPPRSMHSCRPDYRTEPRNRRSSGPRSAHPHGRRHGRRGARLVACRCVCPPQSPPRQPPPLPLVVGLHARFAVPYGALRATKSKRRSQAVACNRESCSCLLRPLLPALAAPSVAALLALAVLVVGRECVAGAEGEGSRCEAVREVDLGANRVGEVGNDENVLDVCVAADVSIDKRE